MRILAANDGLALSQEADALILIGGEHTTADSATSTPRKGAFEHQSHDVSIGSQPIRDHAVIDVTDRRGRSWTQRHPTYTTGRSAALAALLLGGGRASATGAMLWRDVDLANGRFEVGRDKTDAGMREVDMLPLLREILTEHKAASERTGPNDPVFVTAAGTARSRHNLHQDVVDAAVTHAHRLVEERGMQPLPLGITPHKLRHTFVSILVAIGKDPTYVIQQLGHTDPAFTLRVYAHAMRRSEEEREQLKALVEGHDWAQIGHKTAESTFATSDCDAHRNAESPALAGLSPYRGARI